MIVIEPAHDEWEPVDYLNEILERTGDQAPEASTIKMQLRRARQKREKAERMLEESQRDTAVWAAVGREKKLLTTKDMAKITGYGREHLYRIQRDLGVGA